MDKLLVLLHTTDEGALPKSALETIAAARALGAYELGVIGANSAAAAQSASAGAAAVFAVDGGQFAQSRYATDAAAAEAIAKASGAEVILATGTMRFNRALPGVACRLNGACETHIVAIEPGLKIHRWYYRQRMEATLSRAARPWILLLEPGAFESAPAEAGAAATAVAVTVETRTTVTGYHAPNADQQTIRPDAQVLLVAGAGWTKKQKDGATHTDEAATLILNFVRKTQSSLGSSKSLVDLSGEGQSVLPFLTHLHQVGQTGSSPRHRKGLATCCHGEEPHVVGWRFINDRRAINLDAACGWSRGKADVLYVADSFEVMRELEKLL
jgi:electron transfer flavoprotein alpha subunit